MTLDTLRERLLAEANKTTDRDTALVLEELARDIPAPVPCVECERRAARERENDIDRLLGDQIRAPGSEDKTTTQEGA